jgi:hypothetical protein
MDCEKAWKEYSGVDTDGRYSSGSYEYVLLRQGFKAGWDAAHRHICGEHHSLRRNDAKGRMTCLCAENEKAKR